MGSVQGVHINSLDPRTIVAEQEFILVINKTGGHTCIGDVLCFKVDATYGNGINVDVPDSTNISAFAGVGEDIVDDGAVLKAQTHGINSHALVLGHASLSEGDVLKPVAAASHFVYHGAADGLPYFAVYVGAAYTNVTTAALKSVILYGW
jgi:hypothetical protein